VMGGMVRREALLLRYWEEDIKMQIRVQVTVEVLRRRVIGDRDGWIGAVHVRTDGWI
jgi:hypothetical protein